MSFFTTKNATTTVDRLTAFSDAICSERIGSLIVGWCGMFDRARCCPYICISDAGPRDEKQLIMRVIEKKSFCWLQERSIQC